MEKDTSKYEEWMKQLKQEEASDNQVGDNIWSTLTAQQDHYEKRPDVAKKAVPRPPKARK